MKITKRTFALFLVLVLLFTSLCSVNIFADTTNLRYFERGVLTDGTNTAYYIIDKDNRVLYLSGDGITNARTPDYPSADAGPFAGRTDVTRIVIEEGVERIGDYVFANMKSVDTLEIQSNLLSSDSNMSAKAMIGCTSLRNVQGDNSLLSTNVMLEVIKGAINVATAQWWNLALNGINVIKTGVSGDDSLDDEIVAAMINDYIMTGEEVFLGNMEEMVTDYEERIANPCYYNNEYHHSYDRFVTLPAGCTTEGEDTYICSTCGALYHTPTPATGHNFVDEVLYEPSCTKEGVMKSTCTRCSTNQYSSIPMLGHTEGEWEVTAEPTSTKTGTVSLHCAVCGEVYRTAPFSYMVGLSVGSNTAASLKSTVVSSSRRLIITRNGRELSDSEYVGTGCILKYVSASDVNMVYKVETAILYGDLNGDGRINNADSEIMRNEAFYHHGAIAADSVYFIAADLNKDQALDAFDCFLQNGIITGGRSFNQSVTPYK